MPDSLDERVFRDLHLPDLQNLEELVWHKSGAGNQEKSELIQTVEEALYDLDELDSADAIKNPLVTKSIKRQLPEILKKVWLVSAADQRNAVNRLNRFDKLIMFLKSQESIYEQLDQLRDVCNSAKEKTKLLKYARTKTSKHSSDTIGCIVCGNTNHKKKLFFFRKFRTNLTPSERRDAVQQLGACESMTVTIVETLPTCIVSTRPASLLSLSSY